MMGFVLGSAIKVEGKGEIACYEHQQYQKEVFLVKDFKRVQDYKLAFTAFGNDPSNSRWKGAGATILEAPGQHVWGCVWRLQNEHMETLDRQESSYNPIQVTVTGSYANEYKCRTYQAKIVAENMADLRDNRPSKYYMDVIIKGAKQNGICTDYVKFLENIQPNGITAIPDIYLQTMKLLGDEGN